MKIIPADLTHLSQIRDIYNYYVLNTTVSLKDTPFPLEEIQEKYESLRQKGYPYFVAVDAEGNVVGFCYAGPFRTSSASKLAESTIYLAPGQAGAGTGRELYRALFTELEKNPAIFAVMAVITAENTGSVAFHRRLDFQDAGTWRQGGCKFGRIIDIHCLQLLRPFLKEL